MVTKDEDNFLRVVSLNYRVGTTALRRYFDKVHPNLQSDLSSPANISILSSLHKPPRGHKRVLYQEQWNILYPSSGSPVLSSNLDVTLMVCLLRNLPPIVPQPLYGFEALPQSSDLSPGAHIARIKYYKNFIVSHSKDGKLSDNDFNTIWNDLETAINGLGNQQDVTDSATAKTTLLDFNALQELVNRDANIQQNRKILNDHTIELAEHRCSIALNTSKIGENKSGIAENACKIVKLETTVEHIEEEKRLRERKRKQKERKRRRNENEMTGFDSLTEIQRRQKERKRRRENGMTDFMIDMIESWKKDDGLYIDTRATKHVLSCVSKYNCVSVIGPSGCGKTALVRHIALQLDTNGYTIFTVTDAKEIKDQYRSGRKTLYIVDDMCGNFTANQTRIEEWKKSMNDIKSILENNNCKLILTCRLQVFQDKGFTNLEIFKTCECNLSFEGLSLTSKEKESMTAKYFKEHSLAALTHLGKYEILPFLCKLYYIQSNNPKFNLNSFLSDPFSCFEKELTSLYNDCKEGKYKYCALLVLVIFNNKLEEKKLTGKDPQVKEMIEDIIEVCEIDDNITGRKLKSQLEILIGTFVTYDKSIYQTIHDKLFDFLAFYFGSQEDLISILIKHAKPRFVRERFVVTHDYERAHHLIFMSDDKLQMYMKRVFKDIVSSCNVNTNIVENRNLRNVKFRTMFHDYMRHLSKHELISLMEQASSNFLNTMFVMREKDIRDIVNDSSRKYESFGIILPDDMLQRYTDRWFDDLTKINSTKTFMEDNRLLNCVTFRTALKSYMRQLNSEKIASIILTGSRNFLNTMFVITEHDIKDFAKTKNKRFGIVIPKDMLHLYIKRWFEDLTKHVGSNVCIDGLMFEITFTFPITFQFHMTTTVMLDKFINKNRPLMNLELRRALRTYMRQLTTEDIATLIQTTEDSFLNSMFVMTEDDINDNSKNRYEWFGIVIPSDMLHQYIEKFFYRLTNGYRLVQNLHINRVIKHVKGRTALRSHMKQLTRDTIASLIQNAVHIFSNTMFVMTEEDIKDHALSQYECFGIVVPDDLLQQYIKRWFDDLTKTYWITEIIDENRILNKVTWHCVLRTHMRQLTTEKIAAIIRTGSRDFVNLMFVMTEDDIKYNTVNRYECFGIVIPDDLLHQYIQRWFNDLTKTPSVDNTIEKNRPLLNITFSGAIRTYMAKLTTEQIAQIIKTAHDDFINLMFVMTQEDIKDNCANRYEFFGIVIPDDLLQQYLERWINSVTKTSEVEKFIDKNRPSKNETFRSALCNYTRQLNTETISSLFLSANDDFLNKMFVISEENINDYADNCHNCFGVVITSDLLQQYIEKWLNALTNTSCVQDFFNNCRLLNNVQFRTALRTYTRKLNTEKISNLIQSAKDDFINTMFVMKDDDIKDNTENQFECFGIIIPDDLLEEYILRWFENLTKTNLVKEFFNSSRPLMNITLRTMVRTYMKQLSKSKVAYLIESGKSDFLNKIFVMTDNDIKDNAENLYECFGIVIPDDLLVQYIERWFNYVKISGSVKEYINDNRPLTNVTFKSALRTFIRKLNRESIGNILQTGSCDFFNTMFVITEDDIKDNSQIRSECFGIVIPDDFVTKYICIWFSNLAIAKSVKEYINGNRSFMNVTFHNTLRTLMRTPNTKYGDPFIKFANRDIINTMFVMTENAIKDRSDNRSESIGLVIHDDILQPYIEKWFAHLTNAESVKVYMNDNRPLMNFEFMTAVRTFLRQLNIDRIRNLIQSGSSDFVNAMFVMTENDIKYNPKYRFECVGIVIPNDVLQQYIERWFYDITRTDYVKECIAANRCIINVTFRVALQTYTKQLTRVEIGNLIWTGSRNFVNTMFVLTGNDIIENSDNRQECFGVIIPDDLLHQYIERLFDGITKTNLEIEYIDENRMFMNSRFQDILDSYVNGINSRKIAFQNRKGNIDFLNIRRDLFKQNRTCEIKS
ncbi:uncharacterized protein LOC127721316 [Mytilus californianus]|uniref:uncharacterized protein LOC127721316 n=1 Tax=Mytilus californianus TaxID=6549 RepID=UPI002246FF34|nr:uncharacterized protein LOC127721316 [Mytilus californianus]